MTMIADLYQRIINWFREKLNLDEVIEDEEIGDPKPKNSKRVKSSKSKNTKQNIKTSEKTMPKMDLLCRDNLSYEEKTYLARFAMDPGYKVLIRLMEDACHQAVSEVIKLDPIIEKESYVESLKAQQQIARAMNQFSATLRKSIEIYAKSIIDAESSPTAEEEETNPLIRATTVKFPVREDLINQRK
jgi:hypothetical protein